MISIQDIISKFAFLLPPERIIADAIVNFLNENKIPGQKISITIKQKEVFTKGDPYVKLFIKTNQDALLAYLKENVPKYEIVKVV